MGRMDEPFHTRWRLIAFVETVDSIANINY